MIGNNENQPQETRNADSEVQKLTEETNRMYTASEYHALQEQLNAAKQSIADWQQKYEQVESDRKAKEYSEKLDDFVQKQNMKSTFYADYLKKQLADQNLQFDDEGNLIGGDTVVLDLRKKCPEAFMFNPNERAVAPTSGHVPNMRNGDAFTRGFYASTGFPTADEPSKHTNYEW